MLHHPEICWLIEKNVFDDGNPAQLISILRANGTKYVEAGFEAANSDFHELRPTKRLPLNDEDRVMVYGSMNLSKWLLRDRRWPRLAWYDFPRLRCQSYYAHWGAHLLQEKYLFLPLAEIVRRKDWLFETIGLDGVVFIRPDDNAKSFAGGIVRLTDFQEWYRLANFYEPGPDCLAVVSAPQNIHSEWRLVICQKQVVTGSQYRCDGTEAIAAGFPPEAAAFAQTVTRSAAFDPHPVYVMDVARTDHGLRLVEIGSVCCASLYACDLERVVRAVHLAAGNF